MNSKDRPMFVVKKVWDEGTTAPFPARLMLQMFTMRDELIKDEKEKDEFNKTYNPILENYKELSLVITRLKELINKHIKEVEEGSIVKVYSNRQINIEKSIDEEYRAGIKDFFIKGEMTISGLPKLGKCFEMKIAFFFSDKEKFEKESIELVKNYGKNATFILEKIKLARESWYEEFNTYRNHIEHHHVDIPQITYSLTKEGKTKVHFPKIEDGSDLLDMLEKIKEKILELVEDTVIFFFSTKLKPGLVIKKIPAEERDPQIAKKYRIYARFKDKDVPYGNS
jgi:hypothetical protein